MALLRLLFLLVVFLLVLLSKLWAWILWVIRTKTLKPEEADNGCGKVPEVLVEAAGSLHLHPACAVLTARVRRNPARPHGP